MKCCPQLLGSKRNCSVFLSMECGPTWHLLNSGNYGSRCSLILSQRERLPEPMASIEPTREPAHTRSSSSMPKASFAGVTCTRRVYTQVSRVCLQLLSGCKGFHSPRERRC